MTQKGELKDEVSELKDKVNEIKQQLSIFYEKLSFTPAILDKLTLIVDVLVDNKYKTVVSTSILILIAKMLFRI